MTMGVLMVFARQRQRELWQEAAADRLAHLAMARPGGEQERVPRWFQGLLAACGIRPHGFATARTSRVAVTK